MRQLSSSSRTPVKWFVWLGILAFLFGVFPKVSVCQAKPTGVQISPLAIEKEMLPGEATTSTIKIFNPFDWEQEIRLFTKDFIPQDALGSLQFVDYSTPANSLSRMLDYSKELGVLQPKEERVVEVKIEIPQDTPAGSHFAVIFASPVENNPEMIINKHQLKQRVATGTIFLVKVKGEALGEDPYGGVVEETKLNAKYKIGPYYLLTEAPSLSLSFKNTGIFHQMVWGGIEIYNIFGKKVETTHLKEHRVLPKARSIFQQTWKGPGILGLYTAQATILFGKEGEKTEMTQVKFIYLNYQRILSIAILIVLVLVARKLHQKNAGNKTA